MPIKEPPASKAVFSPLPVTARGFGIHLNGTLKGSPRLVYGNGPHVVIREINDVASSRVFTEHKENVNVAKFSPNGEWVASGDATGVVHVWGAKNFIIKNTVRCCRSVLDIDWTGDGQRIVAVGDGGGSMFGKVFSWNSSNAIGEISNNSKKLLSCSFRPDRPFKIATVSEEKQTNFYAGPPFKFVKSDHGHTNYPNCVRYTADGAKFATVGSDRKIVLYDGKTAEKIKVLNEGGHTGSIYSCSWSPDGTKLLTCAGDKTAKIWNVESGTCETTFKFGNEGSDMQVSVLWLGSNLMSVSLSGSINFLDQANPAAPKSVWAGHKSTVDCIETGPDGSCVYSGDRDGRIVRWECKTGEAEVFSGDGHQGSPVGGHRSGKPVAKLAASCDGKKLYSVGFDDKLFVSDTATRTTSDNWVDLEGQPTCLDSAKKNPDLCAVGTSRGLVYMIKGGQASKGIALGFAPSAIAFSPDDSELVIGGKDKLAHIYKVSGQSITAGATLASHTDVVSSVVYSGDGKFLTTSDNGRHVFNWDRNNLSKPINPTGWQFHQARITQCAWTKDSSLLLTCSADEQVIAWPRAKEGKPSKRKKTDPAHLGGVLDMKILDDSTFVTVGMDRFIRVWDL